MALLLVTANIFGLLRKPEIYTYCFSITHQRNKIIVNFSRKYWYHNCAGSIINKWTIISASHCFTRYGKPINPKNIVFIPGLHEINFDDKRKDPTEWNVPVHEVAQVYRPIGTVYIY